MLFSSYREVSHHFHFSFSGYRTKFSTAVIKTDLIFYCYYR